MKKLLILSTDDEYIGPKFSGNQEYHIASKLNLKRIIELLSDCFIVEHIKLKELDINRDYNGFYVIYASSEERGLIYKGFIEDVLMKLQHDGAILVPRLDLFRAHGDKVYQELLRTTFVNDSLKKPRCGVIGKLEDMDVSMFNNYPYVVKSASGSGSSGVMLAKNDNELVNAVRKLSRVTYLDYYYTNRRDLFYTPLIWKLKVLYYRIRGKSQSLTHPKRIMNENKVIVQEFVDGLDSDYKVLYYYGKYFVLNRENRDNDFRASGSGKFVFPDNISEIEDILNFAEICAHEIDAPMISMDICKTKTEECYLIEYQCLDFGPYTAQFSEWHFSKKNDVWEKIDGKIDLEIETVEAIKHYIYESIG